MTTTLLPDLKDTDDLLMSALGGAVGLLIYAYLTSERGAGADRKRVPSPALTTGPKIYSLGFVGAGFVGGHKIYEAMEQHIETKRLLGG